MLEPERTVHDLRALWRELVRLKVEDGPNRVGNHNLGHVEDLFGVESVGSISAEIWAARWVMGGVSD